MELVTRLEQDAVVVRIPEEYPRADDAPVLHRALRDALRRYRKKVVIDMSAVEVLDSPVIGAIVKAQDEYGAANLSLSLCGTSRSVAYIFKCLHLDLRFPMYETLSEALGEAQPQPAAPASPFAPEPFPAEAPEPFPAAAEPPAAEPPRAEPPRKPAAPPKEPVPPPPEPEPESKRLAVPHEEAVEARDREALRPRLPTLSAAERERREQVKLCTEVVRQFIESINDRDWRAAYEAMTAEFARVPFDEYRLNREAYYRKMCGSGDTPKQYLIQVESAEVVEHRALLRCTRRDVSGWNQREYRQDYALEGTDGGWRITRIFTGGRSGKDPRKRPAHPGETDRRNLPQGSVEHP